MFRGLFVTGTDTNVGKTVVSAALMLRYRNEAPLRYWKPIQTGIEHDDDSAEVARLAGLARLAGREGPPYSASSLHTEEIFNCGVRLPHAVSPHLAARLAGTRITVRHLVEQLRHEQRRHEPDRPATVRWIVEGAGGVRPTQRARDDADLMLAPTFPWSSSRARRSAPSTTHC
jgi:dethiobiotin synthetase